MSITEFLIRAAILGGCWAAGLVVAFEGITTSDHDHPITSIIPNLMCAAMMVVIGLYIFLRPLFILP